MFLREAHATVTAMSFETTTVEPDWDAVAPAWETRADEVEEHSRPLTEALLRHLRVTPGDRVLELASGPGSLGPTWSHLVGPTGSVVLGDVSPAMVEAAARRNASHANVEATVLEMSAIDRPDNCFDAVACRMGLMFVADPRRALAEMRRVLRRRGRLGVLTWAAAEHNPWMTCVAMASATAGLAATPPLDGPGVFALGDEEGLLTLARDAGLGDADVDVIAVAFEVDTIEDHVARICALAPPLADAFHAAGAEHRRAVMDAAAGFAARYATSTGFSLPGRALLLSARA